MILPIATDTIGASLIYQTNRTITSRVVESESVESHVFSWSRSQIFKTAGVGVRSWNICCNYRLQCLLNNLNYNINCLKIITGYWQY